MERTVSIKGYIFCLLAIMAFGNVMAEDSLNQAVDGVSATQVLQQIEANQADTESLHQVMVTEGKIASGPGAGSALPKQRIETWIYIDSTTGHRMVKIHSDGQVAVRYVVDMETYEMQIEQDDGSVEKPEFPDDVKAMMRDQIEANMPPDSTSLTDKYSVERAPDQDQKKPQGEHTVALAPNTVDTLAGLQPETATVASIGATQTAASFAKKPGGRRHSVLLRELGRRTRGRLNAWKGKRVRTLNLKPKHVSSDQDHPSRGQAYARMEQDVDMSTGLTVGTRLYDAKGNRFADMTVTKSHRRKDGVTVPMEMKTIGRQDNVKVEMTTRWETNE